MITLIGDRKTILEIMPHAKELHASMQVVEKQGPPEWLSWQLQKMMNELSYGGIFTIKIPLKEDFDKEETHRNIETTTMMADSITDDQYRRCVREGISVEVDREKLGICGDQVFGRID